MDRFIGWRIWDGLYACKGTAGSLGTVPICPIFGFCPGWYRDVCYDHTDRWGLTGHSSLVWAHGRALLVHASGSNALLRSGVFLIYSLFMLMTCVGDASSGATCPF